MKKIPVIVITLLISVSSLWTQQIRMYVKADKAIVYAEPSENSYKIDTVRRGTVLTVFEKGIESSKWIYVTFESKRWKGKVTGFIKTDLVVTEEEWLSEDQMRMEEEAQKQKAGEVIGEAEAGAKTEEEMKAEAEKKPEPGEKLPDLRAAFAKKKPEEKETVEEAEVEKALPATEKEETKEVPEPIPAKEEPPPVVTVMDALTESPRARTFALYLTGEMLETKPYAIIMRESEPPPPELEAEEKMVEEAPAELKADVLAVKAEESPPKEEKEIKEGIPQAQEMPTPETENVEAEEFTKPEPPAPVITVMDGVTEFPRGRLFTLSQFDVMIEAKPYAIIQTEFKPPQSLLRADEKITEEAPVELQADVLAVKKEEPPKEAETPDEDKGRKERVMAEGLKAEEKIAEAEKTEEAKKGEKSPEETEEEEGTQVAKPPGQVTKPPEQVVKPPEQVVKPTEAPHPKLPGKVGLLSFGLGFGPSWGGFGGALQLNINKSISIHVGAGLYPTTYYYSEYEWAKNEWLYSVGIKYYVPFGSDTFRPYVDAMYGGISVEAVQLVKEIWYYEYTYENIQKTLYGPTIAAGADLKLGFIGLNGYLGLSYNTTAWDYWDRDYFLNGGLGIFLFF